MAWNDKVFDNLEQVYWSPDKIGLRSIPRLPTPDRKAFLVSSEKLDGGKSLYARAAKFQDWREAISRKEELLNQVIEIALAIAPSSVIAEAFFQPLSISPSSRVQTIGREMISRHAALSRRQFTQHDGFYLSDNAIVMMEMKLKARTSIEQYLKYCTLAALEEILFGRKDHLGLIYVVPTRSVSRTRKDLLLDDPQALHQVWQEPSAYSSKSTLLPLLDRHRDAIKDVGERLRMAIITWDDLLAVLVKHRNAAVASRDETLENLMHGLINQIRVTADCGLEAPR